MTPVYIVGEVEVTDPEVFAQYLPLAAASIKKYGGTYLARGARTEVLEGPPAKRMVITMFESEEALRRWIESPEYTEAKVLRQKSSTMRMVMVEGVADL
jgi:uncharacterized protein (DUF1330 family)